jgi:hypothetical protein
VSVERVLIEVMDECGGLPGGDPNDLFHSFEQKGTDRTGLGLGLACSRWAVEANHGRIYARNLLEKDASLPSTSRGSLCPPPRSVQSIRHRLRCGRFWAPAGLMPDVDMQQHHIESVVQVDVEEATHDESEQRAGRCAHDSRTRTDVIKPSE